MQLGGVMEMRGLGEGTGVLPGFLLSWNLTFLPGGDD